MKYMRYVALLALLSLPLAYSQAEVRVGFGFGGYVAGPPVCPYGYYPDYPYACAPYGYYGPTWFANGIFIGAGPWYHGWGHPYSGRAYNGGSYYGRSYNGRAYNGDSYNGRSHGRGLEDRFAGHGPVVRRGFEGSSPVAGNRRGSHGSSRGRR